MTPKILSRLSLLFFSLLLGCGGAFSQSKPKHFIAYQYHEETLKSGFEIGLFNPSTSGKTIVIDSVDVHATFELGDTTTEYIVFGSAAASIMPTACTSFSIANKDLTDTTQGVGMGTAQSVAKLIGQPCTADPSLLTGNLANTNTDTFLLTRTTTSKTIMLNLTLPPGKGWVIYTAVGNPAGHGDFYTVYGFKWHEQ